MNHRNLTVHGPAGQLIFTVSTHPQRSALALLTDRPSVSIETWTVSRFTEADHERA